MAPQKSVNKSIGAAKAGKFKKRSVKQAVNFLLFASPGLFGFLVLSVYPIFRSLFLSFTDRTLLGYDPTSWVGFKNYVRAFGDPYVWESLGNSFVYAFATLVTVNVTGLLVALLMNYEKGKLSNVLRTIFYAPSILPAVSMVVMFTWIFNPATGFLNTILRGLGIEEVPLWLEGNETVIPTLIIMSFWSFGAKMVIYLAGLQGISKEYYEAASLDGATPFVAFFRITLPLLAPVLFYNILMNLVGGLQVFTEAYVISGTGTGVPVNFYVLNIFSLAFNSPYELGYASALAWILFVIISVLAGLYFALSRKIFNYSGD